MFVRMIQGERFESIGYAKSIVLILALVSLDLSLADNTFAQSTSLREITNSRLRDLDDHCPIVAPATIEAWQARAAELRFQIRVALGLHPMPTLSQEPVVIHGLRKMDGYTIEKVYFESLPGFYVTGSLYRPLNSSANTDTQGNQKPRPLVLLPHGHWEEGRFYNAKPNEVKELLATGAERFTNAAINHMQAHCVQLARIGIIAFQYDMIGYADSQQISQVRAHQFGINDQDATSTDDGWPFFSPTAEGYLQSIMGLQTINTIQAVNLLGSLPDVDSTRMAITGASGGGTQSFIAMAVDDRLLGAFPAVMVSTGMQGGCTCENACCLRVGTGNVEIAALSAPRSLGLTSANDWTKDMTTDGFPTLQKIYSLFGKKDQVTLFAATQFPHNYNQLSRIAMYAWANNLFQLDIPEPILERDFELLQKPDLTVWDESHPAPESGPSFERKLLKAWGKQIDQTMASSPDSEVRDGWRTLLHPAITLSKSLVVGRQPRLDREENDFVVRNDDGIIVGRARLVGQMGLEPKDSQESVTLRLGNFKSNGDLLKIHDSKAFYQLTIRDPFSDDSTLNDEQPLVSNPRPAAAFTFGYNPPQLVRRVAVLLRLSEQIHHSIDSPLHLTYDNESEFLALGTLLAARIGKLTTFSVSSHDSSDPKLIYDDSIRSPAFLPGSRRYLGLEGLVRALNFVE